MSFHILEISKADRKIIIFKNTLNSTWLDCKIIKTIIGKTIEAVTILLDKLFCMLRFSKFSIYTLIPLNSFKIAFFIKIWPQNISEI